MAAGRPSSAGATALARNAALAADAFHCRSCGSVAITVVGSLEGDPLLRCGRCRTGFGPLSAFRAEVERLTGEGSRAAKVFRATVRRGD